MTVTRQVGETDAHFNKRVRRVTRSTSIRSEDIDAANVMDEFRKAIATSDWMSAVGTINAYVVANRRAAS